MKSIFRPAIPLVAACICIGYFVLFAFPNHAASENKQMVAVFEPDESVPLPYVFHMIEPADTLKQALLNFAFYDYYFYGFPHFALSAFSLLPILAFNSLDNTPLVMMTLRQVVSVLPMIIAILILVSLQTQFKSYKSIILLVFLLSIPAVVRNNFWWHPDSLAILFAILAIFFLSRDNLKFGSNFYLTAIMCGFSAGTKGVGFYFFLTIFVYLLLGFFTKKFSLLKLFLLGSGFLLSMGAAYLFANPILIYKGERERFFTVMREQSILLSSGYEIQYAKGFWVSLPDLTEYYGSALFLVVALGVCITGIVKDKNRLLNIIILTWTIPISILVFGVTHFKFQYWLPVALPLFSSAVNLFPEKSYLTGLWRIFSWKKWLDGLPLIFASLIFFIQLILFINADQSVYVGRLNRAKDNQSIQFYELARGALAPLPAKGIFVYHDVRMYIPVTKYWKTEAIFGILNYDYIRSKNFDVLLLMQQRLYDYLNPSAQGINPEALTQSRIFYRDADTGTIAGYRLVFRNEFGLVYVKSELYEQYFQNK